MLESMRRQGASIFIYLIFCLLIAIFIINFGPSGGKTEGGCSGDSNPILTVDGHSVTQSAFHVAYSNRFNQGEGKTKVYTAIDWLIRREMLAQAAEARGLMADDDLIQDEIKKGYFFLGGQRTFIPGIFDQNGIWNLRALQAWIGELNVTLNAYQDEQKRSLLAAMEQQLLLGSVQVSRDEAYQQFLYDNDQVTYDVLAFRPDDYHQAMHLTEADVTRYLQTHEADVKARYKADERTYKDVKPQLELREIFIAKAEPAAPPTDDKPAKDGAKDAKAGAKDAKDTKADAKDTKAAKDTKDTDAKAAGAPAGMPIDQAKAKLEEVRAAVTAGKEKFADAAHELSTDPELRDTNGELGWNPTLPEKAVEDAAKKLKPGEMTPVITTDRGAYLVLAEGQRQGNLTYDQVKDEIARKLAIETWPKEAARRAAIDAFTKAHDSGKPLDQLFDKAHTPPDMSPRAMKAQIAMIGEMVNSSDVPAESRAGMEQQEQMLEQELEMFYATMSDPKAKLEKPSPDLMKPSADTLPKFDDVPVKVELHGPVPRTIHLPGIEGESLALEHALFDELKPGQLASSVYEVSGPEGDAYYVVQLETHTSPDTKEFDQQAAQDIAQLRQLRQRAFLAKWLRDRCVALAKDGKIQPNMELMTDHDDQNRPKPITWRPCEDL